MTKTKQIVVVLGMHRSGTSTLTKALEALGISLSDNVLVAAEDNQKGFWEDNDIVVINDKLLAKSGLFWRSLNPLPVSAMDTTYAQRLKEEAAVLLTSKLEQYTCWGFKDPRVARLLPFWLDVFQLAGITPKFIFVVRNPLDVARSLEKRDGFLHQHSYGLWLMHVIPNLEHVAKFEHVVVDFADFLRRPEKNLDFIAEKLGLSVSPSLKEKYCGSYIDKSLCHSLTTVTDLMDDCDSTLLCDTYSELRDLATEGQSISSWLKSETAKALQTKYAEYLELQAYETQEEVTQDLLMRNKLLLEHKGEISAVCDDLNHQLAGVQQENQMLKKQIEQQVSELKLYSDELEFYSRELDKVHEALRNTQQHANGLQSLVDSIYRSTSWFVTKPLRFTKRAIQKPTHRFFKFNQYVNSLGGYKYVTAKAAQILKAEGVEGLKKRYYRQNVGEQPIDSHATDYNAWLKRFGDVTPEREAKYRQSQVMFAQTPVISILMPVYNAPEKYFREAIDSIIDQIYPHWELCLADDCSTEPYIREILEEYKQKDSRIKVVYREKNGHISAATNSALELASGEFIGLMDNDDLLPKDALYWIANEINEHPDAALIFSDEDKITQDGSQRFEPYFKSSWNPQLFLAQNCLSHIGVYKTSVAREIDGFAVGMEGSQDWDFALRFIEHIEEHQIRHIPRILYHWRAIPGSTAVSSDEKPYALLAGQRAVQAHFERCNIQAEANLHPELPFVQVRYKLPEVVPKVSLIIPTRNGYDILKVCLDSIYEKSTYQNFEVILVDNGSDDPTTLAYLEEMASKHDNFKVLRDDSPFNYSALNNKAVELAVGEYIALVNNDIEVITPNWLEEMVGHACQPGVGAVGARLWYPDMTLQHGGVILVRGVASHAHKHLPQNAPGYFSRAMLSQNFVAVTAACLVVKKSIFEEVGGLNEDDLTVAFNDIDFCLKVYSAGYKNVWVAEAELIHYESKTRGFEDTPEKQARFNREVQYMQSQWQHLIDDDPYYNPNLTGYNEDFSLAAEPRIVY